MLNHANATELSEILNVPKNKKTKVFLSEPDKRRALRDAEEIGNVAAARRWNIAPNTLRQYASRSGLTPMRRPRGTTARQLPTTGRSPTPGAVATPAGPVACGDTGAVSVLITMALDHLPPGGEVTPIGVALLRAALQVLGGGR